MNGFVNAATAVLNKDGTPGPVYYGHHVTPEFAVIVRRSYPNAPVIWIEWDANDPASAQNFAKFTYGYSQSTQRPVCHQPHLVEPDDSQDSEGQGPSLR